MTFIAKSNKCVYSITSIGGGLGTVNILIPPIPLPYSIKLVF